MSYTENEKSTLNRIRLDPYTHDWLVKTSNKKGMEIGDYAGWLLDRLCIQNQKGEESENASMVIQDILTDFQMMERDRARVRQIAALYASHPDPDEKLAEKLAKACEKAGMLFEEVMIQAQDDPFSSLIARNAAPETKLGQCMMWLTETMIKHPSLDSKIIYVAGEKKGFSESTIRRAKTHINTKDKTYKIKAVRKEDYWAWELVTKDGENLYSEHETSDLIPIEK